MTPSTLAALADTSASRQASVLATRLRDGLQWLLLEQDGRLVSRPGQRAAGDDRMPAGMKALAEAALAEQQSRVVRCDDAEWFLHVHAPPPRLLLVGAVHIAQMLAPMARATGFGVEVIDPRRSFATGERFPGTALSTAWPDKALTALGVDQHSAVVVLTHDPKLDDPALLVALPGLAFYVGALGSDRTQAARRARLREAGLPEAAIERLRGPVGLPIGAIGPAEIALSILAEIVAVRRDSRLADRDRWPAKPSEP